MLASADQVEVLGAAFVAKCLDSHEMHSAIRLEDRRRHFYFGVSSREFQPLIDLKSYFSLPNFLQRMFPVLPG